MQIYAEAESNANAFAFACLFSPSETGGLGLMDTTGETGDASLTACMAEAQQYFCRRRISQKSRVAWRASQGVDGCPVCIGGGGERESATVSRQIDSLSPKDGRGMQAEWS